MPGPAEPRRWSGRVVAVTGASAGVGRAVALRFAQAGAMVGLMARDAAALEDTRAQIERAGGVAAAVPTDVAQAEAVFATADEIERKLGPIDVWVNDAMLTVFSPVSELTPEEVRRVTETTYLGYVHGTMAALARMRPRNRGVIVQVGSALAYRGIPLQAAYCGAKHAIRGFTDSLRAELRHERSGIRVTMVQLPAMNTPQFDWARTHMSHEPRPVAPVYRPEVAAKAIVDAASRCEREIWLGWSTVAAILGNMVAPGFLDRYLARTTVAGQETRAPVRPDRRDNLAAPVHGLHRVHGRFEAEARSSTVIVSGTWARLAGAALGLVLAAASGYAAGRLHPAPRGSRPTSGRTGRR